MANSKEIRRRIKSIQNTWKITKAMELISTVKMKKAQDLALEKKAYIKSMLEIFLLLTDIFKISLEMMLLFFCNICKIWLLFCIIFFYFFFYANESKSQIYFDYLFFLEVVDLTDKVWL